MTPKETILNVLAGRKTDRAPVALVGGGMWSVHHSGSTFQELSLDAVKMADMLVKMADRIHSDIVYVGSGFPNFPVVALGGNIKYRDVGTPDLENPIASTERDLEALDPGLIDSDPVINTIREALAFTRSRIGDEYLVTLTAWGPFTLGARIIGEEVMLKSLYRDPGFVEKVCRFATGLLMRFYGSLLNDHLLDVILLGEPTASGDLISRKQFEASVIPHLSSFVDWVKARGCESIIHICGNTTDRLDLFPATGAACISVDHKTDIGKAKEVLCGTMCLAGNVDPVRVLLQGSVREVEETCKSVLETAGKEGGFILMPGCDIPPTVPEENLIAFMKTALEWM